MSIVHTLGQGAFNMNLISTYNERRCHRKHIRQRRYWTLVMHNVDNHHHSLEDLSLALAKLRLFVLSFIIITYKKFKFFLIDTFFIFFKFFRYNENL